MGRLLVLAILSDRRAVAPPVPCSSAWITSRIPESWNGIDQAPYRSDWHEGERVWNGVQTSKCRFRPGPQEEAAGGAWSPRVRGRENPTAYHRAVRGTSAGPWGVWRRVGVRTHRGIRPREPPSLQLHTDRN